MQTHFGSTRPPGRQETPQLERPQGAIGETAALQRRLFRSFEGSLAMRLWNGEKYQSRAREYVGESNYRIWRLYMAACALNFESGETGVYQILASKRGGPSAALPLTRRHLYPDENSPARR